VSSANDTLSSCLWLQELERKAAEGLTGGKGKMLSDQVTEEHIAEVVSRATGIPVGSLLQGEVRIWSRDAIAV